MKTQKVQLGELVTIVGGGTPSRNRSDYFNGDIPWVTVKDLSDIFFVRTSQERISRLGLENSAARLIPAGNVLLGTRMSVGKAAMNLVDVAINQDFKALFCGPRLDPLYLTFFLASAAPRLEAIASGATVKGVTIEDVEGLKVPIPDLRVQRQIAARLEQADRLYRTRRYALELGDTFLPAAFLELFGDPAENPHRLDRVRVRDLFPAARDGVKCGPFGSALKKHEYAVAGIPVWTMNNVGENEFCEKGCLFVTEQKFEELRAYNARNGDILISRAGTVGRMAIVCTKHPQSIIHTNIIRLSLNSAKVLPIYFVVLMTWFGSRVARLKRGQEDAYTFMSTGTLGELEIPLPPMPLQEQFASWVERFERLRSVQRESLRQAEHLFQSLLHSAFADHGTDHAKPTAVGV